MQPRGQQRYNYAYNESYGRQQQAPQETFGRQQQQQTTYGRQEQGRMPSAWQQDSNPTSHPLSDMDLELEMMKRKRQMLQEQRQLLEEQQQLERLQGQRNNPWSNNSNSRQFENQQPRQSYNALPTFTNMYDSGANQRGFKRPGNPQPWRDAAQPKRYAGNQASFHKAPNFPNKGPAKFSAPAGPRAPIARPNKPKFVPNTGTYKLTERQIEEDIGPVAPPRSGPPQIIYCGPENSSRNVNGRLELVLGRVIREMRDQFFNVPPHDIKMANWQFKVLKERVRMRIQKMMMGKPLGRPEDIHGMYRKVHTARGDLRLLHSILAMTEAPVPKPPVAKPADAKPAEAKPAAPQAKQPVYQEKVDIQKFIKFNIHGKLEAKLDEIFVKLEKVFEAEAASDAALKGETVQAGTEQAGDVEMPEAPKEETQGSEETPESAETPADGEKPEEVKKDESGDVEMVEGTEEQKKPEEQKKAEEQKKQEEKAPEDMTQIDFFEHVLDKAMRKKLPQMLPRYKNYLISIIARDKQFADLGIKAVEDPTPTNRSPLYFVKIFGKPSLPPRAMMQDYLKKFECVSVKKHKTIYNLLFVGVQSEENFKKLLACDGHTLGGKKMEIRSSMKEQFIPIMGSEKKDESKDSAVNTNGVSEATKEEAETIAEEIKKTGLDCAIDDLDDEIQDLLTSINDSEETATDQVETAEEEGETVGEQDEMAEEQDETAEEQDETAEGQDETAEEQDETAEEQDETAEEQSEVAEEQADTAKETAPTEKVEKKDSPDSKVSAIRTRRSSRLPQKN